MYIGYTLCVIVYIGYTQWNFIVTFTSLWSSYSSFFAASTMNIAISLWILPIWKVSVDNKSPILIFTPFSNRIHSYLAPVAQSKISAHRWWRSIETCTFLSELKKWSSHLLDNCNCYCLICAPENFQVTSTGFEPWRQLLKLSSYSEDDFFNSILNRTWQKFISFVSMVIKAG